MSARGGVVAVALAIGLSTGSLGCSSANQADEPSTTASGDDWVITLQVEPDSTADRAQDEVTDLLLSLLADGRIEGYSGGQQADGATLTVHVTAAAVTDVATQLDQLDGVALVDEPQRG